MTGVVVGAGGARNLTDDELQQTKEQVMAGSTLLSGAVSAYTTYQKLNPTPPNTSPIRVNSNVFQSR